MSLILASQSPRRKELLTQLGYQFESCPADIDESVIGSESPQDYVLRLAKGKALHVAQAQPADTFVLGSDTSVVIDEHILGKPKDLAECITMLERLSGRVHCVFTAIAVARNGAVQARLIETQVSFKALTTSEIEAYWRTGEPQDKAGSYGIQGIGGQFVSQIKGSYSAVVGLPLYETVQLLSDMGLPNPLNQINQEQK